ncbi:flavin reductase [Pseudoroseomonas globiformis]|uniref:Flavin reductase n=1 Tax=Teichococcus globiformis TaxID=2307229 RepID=A0ABV7G897_9PROT
MFRINESGRAAHGTRPADETETMTMSVTQQAFRAAMSHLAAAVNIITTDGVAGRGGMTASAVCSVTDAPPTLLTCINHSARLNAMIKQNGVFGVNVLAAAHQDISGLFANNKEEMEARFSMGAWSRLTTGAPVLDEAPVSFDCSVTQVVEAGTHTIFLGEVVGLRVTEGEPDGLVYFRRGYRQIVTMQGGILPGA